MNLLYILDYYVKNCLDFSGVDYSEKLHHLRYFANQQICIDTVVNYCKQRTKNGVKNATINRELTIMRASINFYNKHHDANVKNPFNGFKLFEDDYMPVFLDKTQCVRLLNAAKQLAHPFFYPYLALLLYTGCRKSELIALKWENVHLHQRYFVVRNSLSKNKKTVYKPLNDAAILHFESLKPISNNEFVFYNKHTCTHYKSFAKPWQDVKTASGLQLRLHDLRHTFASLLIQNGVPLYHVSQLLGHSDTRITQKYAHLGPNNLQTVVDLLDF